MASKNTTVKRELCYRRLREIHDASLLAKDSVEGKLEFLACYADVAKIACDFESAHLKIIQDTNSDFDKEDALRLQFDRMRYAVQARYCSFNKEHASPDGGSHSNVASKVRLPKISLPSFSGDVSLWPSFIALFNVSIHNNAALSSMEKYQYLLASLSGEALNAVKNLQFTKEHYAIAYELLIERYQNKRKLATHYWQSLVQAKPMKTDSAQALRKLLDIFRENTRALQLMEFPVDSWDFILLNTLLDKLTPTLRERFEAEHRKIEIPLYSQLTTFLTEYCRVFASISDSSAGSARPSNTGTKTKSSVSLATNMLSCPACQETHSLAKCARFLALTPKARHSKAKELNLCLNCLRLGHGVKDCNSKWKCRCCKLQHHTLLHFDQGSSTVSTADTSSTAQVSEPNTSQPAAEPIVTMTSVSKPSQTVLLSTVRAEALDIYGNPFPVRILLDNASQSNFITENCMQRGGYRRSKCRSLVSAINEAKAATTRGSTSFAIQTPGANEAHIIIEALVLPRISTPLPSHEIPWRKWEHLEGLELADGNYHKPGPVDILLGAGIFTSLLRDGHRIGGKGEPDAFNTIFGWVLLGSVSSNVARPLYTFLSLDSIETAVTKFWQLEEVPHIEPHSEEDKHCEELFARTTRRDLSGRFIVSYPFAKDKPCFVNSRQIAINRFRSLERRFAVDNDFRVSYSQFMQDYLTSGHMELIHQPFPVDGAVFYLPHHGVSKIESTTTKLRVVFDASSGCSNGLSLNQTLLSGPKLQADIVTLLLRFRIGAVALTADVKQMFRQIWIDPEQRDFQRIVWRFSEREPLADYKLKTVTFGISPSPYLAIRCLMKLAADGETTHPLASAALKTSLYVDDVIVSVHSVDEACELQKQLQALLRLGGFELRKWASSHPSVLSTLDPELCGRSLLSFEAAGEEFLKVLGLRWYSKSGCFGFQVNPLTRDCTKRSIFSELTRIFDPLGFLTPLTFAAKRLVQDLWSRKLD